MDKQIGSIRKAEELSHTQMYTEHELFAEGSWLAHPVKTVIEQLKHFENYRSVRILDLGCGVGRNSIPIAKSFSDIPCTVDCVDILPLAIQKLHENAVRYDVQCSVCGTVSSIEEFEIPKEQYDYIIAVSALEHICSYDAFCKKLNELYNGLRFGGVACIIISADIKETDFVTMEDLLPQFELNFSSRELTSLMKEYFNNCTFLTEKCVAQSYTIPRESHDVILQANVWTYVVKKEGCVHETSD